MHRGTHGRHVRASRIRKAAIFLFVFYLGSIPHGAAGAESSGRAHAAERPKLNYDEQQVKPYALPDALTCIDGTKVTDSNIWTSKRRPELLRLFSTEMYGRTPAGRPASMHWRITSME